MRIVLIFFTSFLTMISFLSFAYAEDYSQKIKKIEDLYDNMEYEKCLKEISQLEEYKYSMKKEELLEIYKFKAFIYILSDRKALADQVIKEIYEIDPYFTLPPSISPKLREPFARIKKVMKKEETPKQIKEDKTQTRIIEATAVKKEDGIQKISKVTQPVEKENFFKKNIISISIISAGVALFVPGLVVRLQAASEADDYRKKLENAPRDEIGNIIGITRDDAQKKQDEIDSKVMIGNTLLVSGSLAIVGGITTYFILNKNKDNKKITINFNEEGVILTGVFNF